MNADATSSNGSVAVPAGPVRPMRLAYLINRYPSISHTFIRRELLELERRGHTVLRLAIRPAENALVDPADLAEQKKTTHCLDRSWFVLARDTLIVAVTRPIRFLQSVATMSRLARRSGVGLVRHLAYLVEACWLLRTVLRERTEHVHAHFGTNSAAVAMLMRCLGGPPFSITVHGCEEFDAPVALSLKDKVDAAEFVVGVSHFGRAQIRRWVPYGVWDRVHIVGCTVGPSFLDAAQAVDPASKTFVCVGRLSPEKGHLQLIDAFAELVQSGGAPDAKLVLAGDGDIRPQVEARIAALGLSGRVEITGWVDEVQIRRRILESRDVVLASFAEGLPMVTMEALALGRPVIATSIAGIPELVRPGVSGWLAIAGDSESLVRAMREVLATPADRLDALAAAGRALVMRDHHTATEAAKLEALILASLEKRH